MAASLQKTAITMVLAFAALSLFLVMVHEMHVQHYDEFALKEGGKIFHRVEQVMEADVIALEHLTGFVDDDDDNTVVHTNSFGKTFVKTLDSVLQGVSGNHHKQRINGGADDDDKVGAAAGNENNDDQDDGFDDDNVVVSVEGENGVEVVLEDDDDDDEQRKEKAQSKLSVPEIDDTEEGKEPLPSWWEAFQSYFAFGEGGASTDASAGAVGAGGSVVLDALHETHTTENSEGQVVSISDGNGNTVTAHTDSLTRDDAAKNVALKKQQKIYKTDGNEKSDKPVVAKATGAAARDGRGGAARAGAGGEEEGIHHTPPSGQLPQKRGLLICDGKALDSEVVYWKDVEGDKEFESPISPHHGNHDDRYLTYEYDQGGWNNVRMAMECLIVVAHATGRTIVVPPQQNLYLLGSKHKDPEDKKAHAQMGFEDFFDMNLLYSHKGFHMMHMKDFLAKEGVTGGLHGEYPPGNSTDAWGQKLWKYLDKVADNQPEWMGHYVAFPGVSKGQDFSMSEHTDPKLKERMEEFGGGRSVVHYDQEMQDVHHIHFPADHKHRTLQHHYAFAFFANPDMQTFYKRFIRDYMRYKDPIQCAGARLVEHIRDDARKENPEGNGEFYAIHARRGDFQFKEVKISAEQMVENLKDLIPKGAVVYLSTDDPDGVCKNCLVQRKPCEEYTKGSKPPGCPEDPSWKALTDYGWKVRMLKDYQHLIKEDNPNWFGMIESIVCSRAKVFAGTYFSTFTGYIHRLRGFHGIDKDTYYHHPKFKNLLQTSKRVGHGFSREWRMGWTDEEDRPI